MDKIVVFGGNGQLGQCLKTVSLQDERLIFLSSTEADITNESQLITVFETYTPAIVINCAAYTAVDKAEDEPEEASLLNAVAPGLIAKLCEQYKATLIHISTDFVFEGAKTGLLRETEETKPAGVYGSTKLKGEKAVVERLKEHIIIRTSWLYSEYGHNFAKTMLRLAKDKDELGVVADQVGTPTYAIDLAQAILALVNSTEKKYGLYHYSNEGVASWFDFAHAIFEYSQTKIKLNPLRTDEFPTKAKRPAYSVLDKSKIKEYYQLQIPHWRDSLQICLQKLVDSI